MPAASPFAVARPRRTWTQRLLIATGAVVAVVCLAGAAGVGYGYWRIAQVARFEVDLPPAASGAAQNFLLVGSDSRESIDENDPDAAAFLGDETGSRRSDTLMVARIEPDTERVTLLALPRDLWVPIAGEGHNSRINTAYAGGRQQLINTVQQHFDIDIHHYVEVDFRGFEGLVGAIDGVPMYFDTAMRDRHSGLVVPEPGCATLDPSQALAFARSRHLEFRDADGDWQDDPTGDLGRITRQQIFIRHALDRVLARGLTDPIALNDLVNVAADHIGVDDDLSTRSLLALGRRFASYDVDALNVLTLPVDPFMTDGGASVVQLDTAAAQPILNVFRGLALDAVQTQGIDLSVLNGTGVSHQAADVAGALETIGFSVDTTGDAGETLPHTTVRYGPSALPGADLVARHLTSGAELVEDADLDALEVVLVTGADLTTIMRNPRPAEPETIITGSGRFGVDDEDVTSSSSSTTTTTVVGITPGEAPSGVDCG